MHTTRGTIRARRVVNCAGGWAGDFGARLMVLARMRARIDTLPVVGEPHVVVGEARGDEGRDSALRSAGAGGGVLAHV